MKPRIFLASSVEGKKIAEALQANLDYDAVSTVWDQAFTLSTNTIDRLLQYCTDNDFAVFVFHEDDIVKIRGTEVPIARDNVVFECGMFIGMHGKDSAFVIAPRSDLHLPTDLLGHTPGTYDPNRGNTFNELRAALGRATTDIKTAIEESDWTKLKPIVSFSGIAGGKTYPLKLTFRISNNQGAPALIQSLAFDVGRGLSIDNNAPRMGSRNRYKPRLVVNLIKKPDGTREDIYEDRFLLEPGKSLKSWVPFDPNIPKEELEAAANKGTAGVWYFRCSWFRHRVTTYNYAEEL